MWSLILRSLYGAMQDPPEGLLNTDPGLHPQTFRFSRSGLRICFVTSSPETLARAEKADVGATERGVGFYLDLTRRAIWLQLHRCYSQMLKDPCWITCPDFYLEDNGLPRKPYTGFML